MPSVLELLKETGAELLVLNRDDADQSAMDTHTYALAVEIRDVPLLLV